MHPTIDEQLSGALRLLDLVAEEDSVDAGTAATLANVRRLVQQVQRSWSVLLPFYLDDNHQLENLLDRLAPSDRRAEYPGPDASTEHDLAAVSQRNSDLRDRLAVAIRTLPPRPDAAAERAAIRAYLAARIAADPS